MKLFIPLRPGMEAVVTLAVDAGHGPRETMTAGELVRVLRHLRELGRIGDPTCPLHTETTLLEER